jgi:hypothetical protein
MSVVPFGGDRKEKEKVGLGVPSGQRALRVHVNQENQAVFGALGFTCQTCLLRIVLPLLNRLQISACIEASMRTAVHVSMLTCSIRPTPDGLILKKPPPLIATKLLTP